LISEVGCTASPIVQDYEQEATPYDFSEIEVEEQKHHQPEPLPHNINQEDWTGGDYWIAGITMGGFDRPFTET
jgi:hypothetical protein